MCGVVGILRTSDRPLPRPAVMRRMLSTIEYRGPDDSGEYLDEDVQLGVVRLAIIDLKGGRQPSHGCADRVVSVYNGEIYNHHDLRAELVKSGHALSNECDSDVVPHLYEESGTELVQRLRGMFAFALWDKSERRLMLARDRLGVKPLYFAQTSDYLIFGSEIKAILASGLIDAEIDRSSLDDLFSMSYPCPPKTMFKGVYELRPAHRMVARAGTAPDAPARYWSAPFKPVGAHEKLSRRDAAEHLRGILREKVYDHLQSDVRVATYLSGGIDSSSISALVKEVTGDPPQSFSIGFDTEEHDEREFAEVAARHLDCPQETIVCDNQTANDFPRMIWHTEMPLQFPLALPLMQLSSLARARGYPVVLTGEGADETMGGYDCFRAQKMRRMLDRPGLRRLRPPVYGQLYKWHGMPTGTVDRLLEIQSRPAQEIEREFGGVYPPWYDNWLVLDLLRDSLLSPGGRQPRWAGDAPEGFDALLSADVATLHPFDQQLALELETRLPSWILLIGDRASMANSVEARVPFLDHEIVEFLAGLHPAHKMRGFTEKAVLRDAMSDALPRAITTRQKRPFYTPLRRWFFEDNAPDFVEEALSEQSIRVAGMFRPEAVKALRQELLLAPTNSLRHVQAEWMLVLTLGSQLLHQMFVADFAPLGASVSGVSGRPAVG